MLQLGILGGLGAPEVLILLVLLFFIIVLPILWLTERSKRKIWQKKAEQYEAKLMEKL